MHYNHHILVIPSFTLIKTVLKLVHVEERGFIFKGKTNIIQRSIKITPIDRTDHFAFSMSACSLETNLNYFLLNNPYLYGPKSFK